jgi:hypothetical protein
MSLKFIEIDFVFQIPSYDVMLRGIDWLDDSV